MAKVLHIDNIKELRTLIDQQHLLYLEFDENLQKIDQRDKLESYMREYLYLASHNTKFTFQETADVLHQSATTKNNFSAYKAAIAWRAIGKYADNLISHPWRKEYRNIKLYCGFYKHEIEENLVGAEHMFEAMGYRRIGHSSLSLQGILDPDKITSVSKDAILAYVECQIMNQIWENLSALYQITWLEILEFRETHICTPDQVISSLIRRHYQKRYNEKFSQIQSVNNDLISPECHFRHNSLACFSHSQYPGHSVPVQTRYEPVVSPQQAIPSSALYPSSIHPYFSSHHSIKPQDFYSVNDHHRHTHYPSHINLHSYAGNGYSLESMIYPTPSVVPTGQLIELDASPTFNGSEQYFQRAISSKYNCPPELLQTARNDELSLSGKAKDDGAGSWENWDYVYRNLESHGYKKNYEGTGELSLKENQQSSSQNNSSEVDVDSIIQTYFIDKMRKINLDRTVQIESVSSKSCSDNNDELKSKTTKEKTKGDTDKNREPSKTKPENKPSTTSPEKCKKESTGTSTESNAMSNVIYAKVNVNQKKENNSQFLVKDSVKFKKSAEDVKPLVVNLNNEEEKWQCVTCTYLNSAANNVCEMCCKSKERGHEINPQPTGGQECHRCTLVNKPGVNFCSACNVNLNDSPTYI